MELLALVPLRVEGEKVELLRRRQELLHTSGHVGVLPVPLLGRLERHQSWVPLNLDLPVDGQLLFPKIWRRLVQSLLTVLN